MTLLDLRRVKSVVLGSWNDSRLLNGRRSALIFHSFDSAAAAAAGSTAPVNVISIRSPLFLRQTRASTFLDVRRSLVSDARVLLSLCTRVQLLFSYVLLIIFLTWRDTHGGCE